MDLFLNYNSKIAAIDTQIDLTGGYSYQDFRDANDGSSFLIFKII
jgi:iron complex outermembrane receptor protein